MLYFIIVPPLGSEQKKTTRKLMSAESQSGSPFIFGVVLRPTLAREKK